MGDRLCIPSGSVRTSAPATSRSRQLAIVRERYATIWIVGSLAWSAIPSATTG